MDVSCQAVNLAPFANCTGPPQKKGVSPGHFFKEINHVKGVSCVVPCLFVPSVQSVPIVIDNLSVCKPRKEPVSQRGNASSDRQVGSRKSGCPVIPSLLQLVPKPNNKCRPILHLSQLNLYLTPGTLKMETPETIRLSLLKRVVGNVTGFQRHILPHSHQSQIKKISEVVSKQADLPIYCLSFWFGHSPIGIYQGGQGSETYGTDGGYENPPAPR